MTNHREQGNDWLEGANEEGITSLDVAARSLAALAHFVGAFLDREEEHQADKFEASPLRAYAEHDDDNPDSLAEWEDGDTVVRSYVLGHIPTADIVAGLSRVWDDEPSTVLPYPWGAA